MNIVKCYPNKRNMNVKDIAVTRHIALIFD